MAAVAEIVVWWFVAAGVWLVTAPAVVAPELIAAGLLSIPCAFAAHWARRANEGAWKFDGRWIRWALWLPPSVVVDTLRLARSTCRREPASIETLTFPPGTPRESAARRACAVWVLAATPGTVVLDADPETDTVTVHCVVGASSSLRKSVTMQ